MQICKFLLGTVFAVSTLQSALGQTAVLTGQYDNIRTGANLNERILNTSNVNSSSFGALYSLPVDGNVYAQPLYVPNLKIGGRLRNVLFVATLHNSVYAFDVTARTPAKLWQVNLGPSVPATSGHLDCPNSIFIGPELGILSTPTIDRSSGTLYVVSATPVDVANPGSGYVHRLFALNLKNRGLKYGSPVTVTATVAGTGRDTQNGQITLNTTRQIQRTALLQFQGGVYLGFGACGPDSQPFHGWVVGYQAKNVQQRVAVFNATPNSSEGGIWQSGRGLATDGGGIYVTTGNARYDGIADFGDSLLKLDSSGSPLDWFTPSNWAFLQGHDLDLSSGGAFFPPNTDALVAAGKDGTIYVLNPGSLGKQTVPLQSFQGTAPCTTDPVSGLVRCHEIHSFAYWDRSLLGSGLGTGLLYLWGGGDQLRAYAFSNGQFNTTPVALNPLNSGTNVSMGGTIAISALSGLAGTGILWGTTFTNSLHAFDASDISRELWNSAQNPLDSLGVLSRYAMPTIADGKVFVATSSGKVMVYGLTQ
jgi:hypothetical protein